MLITLLFFSFAAGLLTFPVLFYFQRRFHLAVPDLEKTSFHIHHSFWGVLISSSGILAFYLGLLQLGIVLCGYGLGWLIHHELTEPGWKFIYFRKKK